MLELKVVSEDGTLNYDFFTFFDWLGFPFNFSGDQKWLVHEVSIVDNDGYKFSLKVSGEVVKNGLQFEKFEEEFPAFWGYGNGFEPDEILAEILYNQQGLYGEVVEPWNIEESKQFLIYNPKREEFMVVEFIKYRNDNDWYIEYPDSPYHHPYNPKSHMTWKFPQKMFEEWIRDEIYWKRPYTLTIDWKTYIALKNREISRYDVRLILILTTVHNYCYYLTGRNIYKLQVVHSEEHELFREPSPYY